MESIYNVPLDMIQMAMEVSPVVRQPGGEGVVQAGGFQMLLQQMKSEIFGMQDVLSNNFSLMPGDTDEEGESNYALAQEWLATQLLPAHFADLVQNPAAVPEESMVMAVVGNETVVQEPVAQVAAPIPNGEAVDNRLTAPLPSADAGESDMVQPFAQPIQPAPEKEIWQTPQKENPLPVQETVKQPEVEQPVKPFSKPEEAITATVVEAPLFRDVQTVPIKVAETEAPEGTPQTDSVEVQIGDKLLTTVQNGESHVEIQLEPESLGRVTVDIVQREGEAIQVVLRAKSLRTQELLEKHIPSLQALLADRGQKTVQVELQHQQENQQSDHQQPFQENQNRGHGQQQERRQPSRQSHDFLHQLRLGLIPVEEVS
ncbi:MAG: hypothetical protein HFH02_13000 [Dorea sp.]|nr:hypothetical protein [Dorea sp.]